MEPLRQVLNTNARCYITGIAHNVDADKKRRVYIISVNGPENAVRSIWASFVSSEGLRIESEEYSRRQKGQGDKYERAGDITTKRFVSCIHKETNLHNLVILPINYPSLLWVRRPEALRRDPTQEELKAAQATLESQLLAYINTRNTIALPQWATWLWQQTKPKQLTVQGDILAAYRVNVTTDWPAIISNGLATGQITF